MSGRPAEVVVLVPVLGRPERVQPLLDSLHAAQADVVCRPVFIVSRGDEAEAAAVRASGADHLTVEPAGRGDWAVKINHGYRETTEPWLLLAADDVRFHPGWADEAIRVARGRARVVGTNDGGRNREVRSGVFSPHPLVARSYIVEHGGTMDASGDVVCELYSHNWPDRELADVARARGEWAFARGSVVEHLHPNWPGGLPTDATYERGRAGFDEDARLFMERAAMWRRQRVRR